MNKELEKKEIARWNTLIAQVFPHLSVSEINKMLHFQGEVLDAWDNLTNDIKTDPDMEEMYRICEGRLAELDF